MSKAWVAKCQRPKPKVQNKFQVQNPKFPKSSKKAKLKIKPDLLFFSDIFSFELYLAFGLSHLSFYFGHLFGI
ncbi:MAG: hypothetical protein NT056_03890 [Proteobacteria bacterium]|nr:hypothetical protein [Pseudomonadota bacterium]